MTLMPFLLAFLVIFGIATQGVYENYLDFTSIQKSSEALLSHQRNFQNLEQKLYRDQSAKQHPPQKSSGKKKHDKTTKPKIKKTDKDPKDRMIVWQRLNITPLFTEEKNESLQKIFQTLITTVYHEIITKKSVPKFSKELLRLGKKQLKNFPNILYFEKISFENSSFQNCWYRMLKGSQNYNFEKNQPGYPSILDLIEYSSTKKNIIALPYIHPEIVSVLFDRPFALKWLALQKKQSKQATKEKLYAMLSEKHVKYDSDVLANLVSFPSKREFSTEEIFHDKNSFLKKKIYWSN